MTATEPQYGWRDAEQTCAHAYVLPAVLWFLDAVSRGRQLSVLDIGCGNGYVAGQLADRGYDVLAVDSSIEGIAIARAAHANVRFEVCSLYADRLVSIVATPVDCIMALEVVEHLVYPRKLFEVGYQLLKPRGYLVVSTPYHGYLKNLAISLLGRWDRHFTVDWNDGHIKFFSKATLARMATSTGFRNLQFRGAGRVPGLWKSMVLLAQK